MYKRGAPSMPRLRVDRPLQGNVKDGVLAIEIGINVLAWAFDHQEDNNPYNEKTQQFEQTCKVTDNAGFAKEILDAMFDEDEVGNTPLTMMIDKCSTAAVDAGSLHITEGTEVE